MMGAEAGLDLGGIAKGWAIDKCVEALLDAGFKDIYMEWCVLPSLPPRLPSGSHVSSPVATQSTNSSHFRYDIGAGTCASRATTPPAASGS